VSIDDETAPVTQSERKDDLIVIDWLLINVKRAVFQPYSGRE
jgi:hypothetical protein